MNSIDTRELVSRLRVIESVAVIPRVTSTNALARRVLDECMANEIPLPSAVIIAREQTAGRGRGTRIWHSPADGGIYATMMHTRSAQNLVTLPLEVAIIVALFLRETYSLEARIKWPNDILVGGKKIAGILIEARTREADVYALIGTGINVAPVARELAAAATSISESAERSVDLDQATMDFVQALDHGLDNGAPEDVIGQWRALSVHREGEPVAFWRGLEQVNGLWEGIDPSGRALIREGGRLHEISAADLILME